MTTPGFVTERYKLARIGAALICAATVMSAVPAFAVDIIDKSFSDSGSAADTGQPQGTTQQPSAPNGTAAPQQPPLTLDQRVTRMEHMLESGTLVDMLTRLNSMEQELQTMRGELELQQHDLDDLQKHQRDLYLDIDRRLLEAVTGEVLGRAELDRIAERAFTLERLMLARAGRWRKMEETLSSHFRLPCRADGTWMDREDFLKLMDEYYDARGWDRTAGWPKAELLRSIDLSEAVPEMNALRAGLSAPGPG